MELLECFHMELYVLVLTTVLVWHFVPSTFSPFYSVTDKHTSDGRRQTRQLRCSWVCRGVNYLLILGWTTTGGHRGSRLCSRSGSSINPVNRQITWSCGGWETQPRFFYLFIFRDFSTVSWWITRLVPMPWTCLRAVPRVRRSPRAVASSCRGITSLRSNPVTRISEELTIIATGAWEASVSTDGSHSSKVRPEVSSSTRCSHTSTTRAQSPYLKRRSLYSSYVGTQLELLLYSAHPSSNGQPNLPKLQRPVVSRTHLRLLLRWPNLASLYASHLSGLVFCNSSSTSHTRACLAPTTVWPPRIVPRYTKKNKRKNAMILVLWRNNRRCCWSTDLVIVEYTLQPD